MKKYLVYFTLLCFFIPVTIFAHQPNYIDGQTQIVDSEPDISKAYYGELPGDSAVYTIYATSSLKLYVQILSPKIQNANKDFNVVIKDSKQNIISSLSTSTDGWQSWYEEYGGDWYWQGPSFTAIVPAGTYDVIVSNTNNTGKYCIAIGETESFPISNFVNTIDQLYKTKTKFFNEPWYGVFYGIIGKYLLFGSLIIILILTSIIYFYIHIKDRNINNRTV